MYKLRQSIDVFTSPEKNQVFYCNSIVFHNTGATPINIRVTNSIKQLLPGATLAFNANHPEVINITSFDWEFPSGIGELTIIKETLEKS